MSLTVCPAAVVAAPVDVIWENLSQWERYPDWFDRSLRVEQCEPVGPATVGQTIMFAGKALARTWHFTFTVEGVNSERHQLDLHPVSASAGRRAIGPASAAFDNFRRLAQMEQQIQAYQPQTRKSSN